MCHRGTARSTRFGYSMLGKSQGRRGYTSSGQYCSGTYHSDIRYTRLPLLGKTDPKDKLTSRLWCPMSLGSTHRYRRYTIPVRCWPGIDPRDNWCTHWPRWVRKFPVSMEWDMQTSR